MSFDIAPWVRIAIRIAGGYFLGTDTGDMLAADPDVVNAVIMGIMAINEAWYMMAKRVGWRT